MSADTSPTPQPQSPTPTPASTPRTLSATPSPDNNINTSFSSTSTSRSLTPYLTASTPNLNLSEQTPTYSEHGDMGSSQASLSEEYGTSPVYGSEEKGFSPECVSERSSQQSTPMPAGMSPGYFDNGSPFENGLSSVRVPDNSSEDATFTSAGFDLSESTTDPDDDPPKDDTSIPKMLSVVSDLKKKALEKYRKNTSELKVEPWTPSNMDPNFRKTRKEILVVFKMIRSTSFADLRSLKSNLSTAGSQRFQPELPALSSCVSLSSYGRN